MSRWPVRSLFQGPHAAGPDSSSRINSRRHLPRRQNPEPGRSSVPDFEGTKSTVTCRQRDMWASDALKVSLITALLASAAFAQTPNTGAANLQGAEQRPRERPPLAATPNTDIHYKLAPEAIPQEGVPKGEIRGPLTLPSEAYPGTQHTYWVYVPAQYDAAVSASLMIYNDGQAF